MIDKQILLTGVVCGACLAGLYAKSTLPGVHVAGRTVSYAHLDLEKTAGRVMLYERLQRTVKRVCEGDVTVSQAYTHEEKEALGVDCYQDLLSDAIGQVGHAGMSALHQQTPGSS